MRPNWFVIFISLLFHLCYASILSLLIRALIPRILNYCPQHPQSPSHAFTEMSYPTSSASDMPGRKLNDGTMMAAVIYEAGGPEVLKVEECQIPKPVGHKMTLSSVCS